MSPSAGRAATVASVFELAAALPTLLTGPDVAALKSLYEIEVVATSCVQPKPLADKYGTPARQQVVSVTNRATLEQTWYNKVRTLKPQTFEASAKEGLEDPTSGKGCDFCDWGALTAEDEFGRVDTPTCVSASNLFKYCAPFHGLVVFKEHDPLKINLNGVVDLMRCSAEWFRRAAAASVGRPLHPFLLWNCLHRAGASQFHGHAQVMASHTPIPEVEKLAMVSQRWPRYYLDILRAHRAAGLLCGCGEGEHRAWAYVHLSPIKDMEIVIQARGMRSSGLHRLLHAALRTLIDDLGVASFNVGVLNIQVDSESAPSRQFQANETDIARAILDGADEDPPLVARIVSRGKLSSKASDFGGLEVFGGASIGHTDPFSIAPLLRRRLGSHAIDPAIL
mmetsp:Transcript_40099/g.71979  ORF Transcript_40099/g.71979 Transcript_40099/m.71979 type:complete len:394 (-) Transcript_40099:103-1284(-)|eukprot:CAMPEP_0177762736 /NCGR_PEP_ID=MMETSP0491_2-20121128/6502_1 /TAXON_ID=63592 /ORGANISM="Tetraselmis chuii, Strain PLY429" /LENGTH=393 /DNA_ID=CAMNT_0019278807 /DNA_START=383 /DNA_END=1564 /DNA_ORIENTATION=-